jgi:hypothetical protein
MKQERHSVCTGHAPTISVNAALSTSLDLDRRSAPDKVRHPRRSRQAPKRVYGAVKSASAELRFSESVATAVACHSWHPALDEAVNNRDLSTGETGEFAGENVGFGLNRGG